MEEKKRANTGLSKHSVVGIFALGPRLLCSNLYKCTMSIDPYEIKQVSRLRRKLMDTFKGRRNNIPECFFSVSLMNTQDKIKEGQTLLDNKGNYRPLASPMVTETDHKVKQLITDLHNGDHIDDMTEKWLCQTPNPPRTPEFYNLTKIHKPSPVGRPIVSGCDGPTEKLSSFVDRLLQPIAQQQKSYLKDTTDFVNFIENTKAPADVILVSMDVTSLYTNIPQEEGIDTVCRAYEIFYRNEPPTPTQLPKRALRLILQENSFQFNGKKLPSKTWYGHGHENGSRLF